MADISLRANTIEMSIGAIVVAGIALGGTIFAVTRDGTAGTPCGVQDTSFLSFPSATQMALTVNRTWSTPPLMAGGPTGESAITKSFVAARTMGYLAKIAINGPDRPAEDRYASSLGYTIGKLPLVPLMGDVVAHNETSVLEVYQTNWVFDSATAASELVTAIDGSAKSGPDNATGGDTHLNLTVALGVPVTAYHRFNGPNDGAHESVYLIVARLRSDVVELSVQGGVNLTVQKASEFAQTAVLNAQKGCQVTPAGPTEEVTP